MRPLERLHCAAAQRMRPRRVAPRLDLLLRCARRQQRHEVVDDAPAAGVRQRHVHLLEAHATSSAWRVDRRVAHEVLLPRVGDGARPRAALLASQPREDARLLALARVLVALGVDEVREVAVPTALSRRRVHRAPAHEDAPVADVRRVGSAEAREVRRERAADVVDRRAVRREPAADGARGGVDGRGVWRRVADAIGDLLGHGQHGSPSPADGGRRARMALARRAARSYMAEYVACCTTSSALPASNASRPMS